MLFFCNLERNFFIIYKFFYEVTGYVETGTGYIVVGTSLSCVDLKEFVTVVADILFDIKVGKSYITDGFQQILDFCHQLFLRFCDDDCMVAGSVWSVFL